MALPVLPSPDTVTVTWVGSVRVDSVTPAKPAVTEMVWAPDPSTTVPGTVVTSMPVSVSSRVRVSSAS